MQSFCLCRRYQIILISYAFLFLWVFHISLVRVFLSSKIVNQVFFLQINNSLKWNGGDTLCTKDVHAKLSQKMAMRKNYSKKTRVYKLNWMHITSKSVRPLIQSFQIWGFQLNNWYLHSIKCVIVPLPTHYPHLT